MPLARWSELASQSILHTFIGALYVEALVRGWRIRHPDQRLGLRLLALATPLVLVPALVLLYPARRSAAFLDEGALFAGRHWDELRLLGVGLHQLWLGAFAAAGTALFLMDLLPLFRRRRDDWQGSAPPDGVAVAVAELARRMRLPPPAIHFRDTAQPFLFCTGVRKPALVISRGTLDLLDPQELRAALAHELGHLSRRDPAVSWGLMGARALQFFNPAFQVVARAMAKDAEWRADESAARTCGDRLALAAGLLKLYRATEGVPAAPGRRNLPLAGALAGPLAEARALDLERRCRRLLEPAPRPAPWGVLRVLLAAAALSVLLYFVA
ncbi:MAG TPA: M56 family metallopeptidase [Anaeromyxobacteraceae bacterium]|jgi:Zn-dependent protease with chaperone function|nr:M56 family metallopeptidase [Anaeromyxobacteraceae bacterium]